MKKLISIIFVSFFLSGNAYAFNKLKGINEVDLLVEVYGSVEECPIKKEGIVTTVKYILQKLHSELEYSGTGRTALI